MANKTYAQRCPVSRALDIIGERWTLLIIRDLGFGLRRFSELQGELVGISPSLLSGRLRQLTEAGVIERIGNRYQLTERGVELLDVVNEIGRWGIGLMGHHVENEQHSDFFPRATIGFMIRPELLPDEGLIAELHLDDRIHTLEIAEASIDLRPSRRITVHDGPATAPVDVRLRGSFDDLTRYRQGKLPAGRAFDGEIADLDIDGEPDAKAIIGRLFSAG